MPKLTIKAGLIRCGRCGRRYTNPLAHVCAGRGKGRTRVRPAASASVKCPRCGKAYANPLTHVCASKPGDFRRRAAAAEKRRKAEAAARRKAEAAARRKARRGQQHDYATCRDKDCQRVACDAYKAGYDDGFGDGLEAAEVANR
jgi:hypothetical protein